MENTDFIPITEYLNESELIDYMKQVADMFKGQRQSDYWQWKVDHAKELKHVNTVEIRKQYPQIDEYLKNSHHQVVQKECYKNAGQLCINCEGVDYVEGEISYHGIPIEHAWNKIDGKYFDITKDVLFSKNSDYAEYVSIIELDTKEYSHMLFKHKHWGGFVHEKYAEERGKKSVFESSKMDNYYEKNFGIKHGYNTEAVNSYDIVAKVGKYKTPIMKNPKSLEGFDPDVRAISDEQGNLYVSYKRKYFNHGEMANALIKADVIKTLIYNQEADKEPDLAGVYDDQTRFILFDRLEDEDIFVPSDTFEWEGSETEKLLTAVKNKNPQFKFDMKYFEDDDDYDLDESFKYPSLFETPDNFRIGGRHYETERDLSYAFEVVWDEDNEKILDVLVSNKKNSYHGTDPETAGFWRGGPQNAINNKTKPYGVNWKKIYPGRLFMEPKIITFWVYPSNKELKQIVGIIEKKKKIQIYDNDWKIEIYPEGMRFKGQQDYSNNYDRDRESKIIPIEKYIGSKKPSEKAYLQHLDTKTKHKVPYGFGSKNPAYMGKRQWQMASATDEGKDEGFYPRLDEVSHEKIGKFNFKDFEKWDAGGIDHIEYKDSDKLIDKNPMLNKAKENNDRGKKITYKQSQDFGKKLIVTTKDGVKIYFVDGTHVRDVKGKGFDIDFTMGGHAYIYPHYIPEDEAWIDEDMDKEDKYTTIVHELTERKEMKNKHAPYDKAHDDASAKEEKVRKEIEKEEGEDK